MTETDTAPVAEQKTAPSLPRLNHREGCPEKRTEVYESTRPADPAKVQPATIFIVRRCLDCGDHAIKEKTA